MKTLLLMQNKLKVTVEWCIHDMGGPNVQVEPLHYPLDLWVVLIFKNMVVLQASSVYQTSPSMYKQIRLQKPHLYIALNMKQIMKCLALVPTITMFLALCAFVEQRTMTVMMPGRANCPSPLNTEYSGYLMANQQNYQHTTETLCIDDNPDTMLGSEDNTNGALIFFIVADCNHSFIPCDPYKHLVPISCAVCSY